MSKKIKLSKEAVEYAWLNLTQEFEELDYSKNIFMTMTEKERENPVYFFVRMLRDPKYFHFTCSTILNKEPLPFQLVILNKLWRHAFPMLIATRGGGKCITGDSLIMTDSGIVTIGNLIGYDNQVMDKKQLFDKVLNENGSFNNIEYGWNNGFSETIKLVTNQGFSIEGTTNHPIRVFRNERVEWVELKDINIETDYILIDRTNTWFDSKNSLPEDLSYLFGLLIGDGGFTVRGRITFTSADSQLHSLANQISIKYFEKGFVECGSKYSKNLYSTKIWDNLFSLYGFISSECGKKDFPKSILCSKKESVAAFIRGLFDTDGSVHKTRNRIEYCSKSYSLVKTLQFVLTKFGIISKLKSRLNKKYNTSYHYLYINGNNAKVFRDAIGFGLKRKSDILNSLSFSNSNTNVDIWPGKVPEHLYLDQKNLSIDKAIKFGLTNTNNYFYDKVKSLTKSYNQTFDVHCLDDHSFISNGIISHNSFILGMYCILRALIEQGCKIVIVGAAFRQSKIIFEYIERIWSEAPLLRDIVGASGKHGPSREPDKWTFTIGDSTIIAIPLGDGTKIRGLRANYIITDEFDSVPEQVYENVVAGFGSVSLDPVTKVKARARRDLLKKHGLWNQEDEATYRALDTGNQAILSGTAGYSFRHFAKYWRRYKAIVESHKDPTRLRELDSEAMENEQGVNPQDYCVIRIPVHLMPPSFMDEKTIARQKATMLPSHFQMEYGACFPSDSHGFFKRSLIESAVTKEPIVTLDGPVQFHATIKGNPGCKYIYGVDPASEVDRFSIVVLEIHPNHRRVVYGWTTTKAAHRKRLSEGLTTEQNFYVYCARKIRDLRKIFPCEAIGLDAGGGGIAVEEALRDTHTLEPGEFPIYQFVDPDDKKETDRYQGDHILYMCSFSDAKWVAEANHGLRKDIQELTTLFPYFDSLSIAFAIEQDKTNNTNESESFEDCVLEIEELKDELTTIKHSQTPLANRDKWDTPETKEAGNKKGRLRKDRYTALLIANMIARTIHRVTPVVDYPVVGGFAKDFIGKKKNPEAVAGGNMYIGPEWFVKGSDYGTVVRRR